MAWLILNKFSTPIIILHCISKTRIDSFYKCCFSLPFKILSLKFKNSHSFLFFFNQMAKKFALILKANSPPPNSSQNIRRRDREVGHE